MLRSTEQLDRRFDEFKPWLPLTTRPSHGWVKAIRQALGMTTRQMAKRLNVAQTRISELEAAEANRNITLKSLDRAAEVLGCRVVYVLVPNRALGETLRARAHQVAEHQLFAIEQSMRLEDQVVRGNKIRKHTLDGIVDKLLRRPSRLWDDPNP